MQKLKMGKQSKPKRAENIGKGKVTPVQIAFIVDRYLSDNHFNETRSTFRSEASHLLSKSPINEAPRSLLSLGAMLDEYICLKEQRVFLEQEKAHVQNLLRGMQEVVNGYNARANPTPPPTIPGSSTPQSGTLLQQTNGVSPISEGYCSAYTSPVLISASIPSNTAADAMKFSTPNSIPTTSKRKGSKDVSDASTAAKKSRTQSPTNQLTLKGKFNDVQTFTLFLAGASTMPQDDNYNNILKSSAVQLPVQGSNNPKFLSDHPVQSLLTNYSDPKTPPIESSSQTDKSISPFEICSTATSIKEATPSHLMSTNHMIISSETIRVTPTKQIAYYSIERNHCVSTSSPVKTNLKRSVKRDQVKGRLDFDASDIPSSSEVPQVPDRISTSDSEKEGDIFDLDLPNFDLLGADFNLSELLYHFDIDGQGIDHSCQDKLDISPDTISGSPYESGNVNIDANQIASQISSTVTKVFSEKETSLLGSDTVKTVKSVTKRIQLLSPVKSNRSSRH
ncbi:cell wall protein RBR3 isoform X2 [Capsicum annuum]